MYFTSGSDRAFEQLMQGKPGFDHYDSGEAVTPEDCGTCRFYRPHWKYQFCVYAECPYQPGKLTAYDAVTFRVKGVENMAVFRVERNKGYTVMSNHHLRNKDLSLKAKGLLSQIPKCKKCGGKVISAYTNIEIETNGVLKTVTNTPAKKCSKCGHIIVDDITMEKAKQYANDYPANTIDYAMCEAEEVVVIQTLLL